MKELNKYLRGLLIGLGVAGVLAVVSVGIRDAYLYSAPWTVECGTVTEPSDVLGLRRYAWNTQLTCETETADHQACFGVRGDTGNCMLWRGEFVGNSTGFHPDLVCAQGETVTCRMTEIKENKKVSSR